MHIEIFLDGKTYISAETEEYTIKEMVKKITASISDADKFVLYLKSGRVLLLPREALHRAHFIFRA